MNVAIDLILPLVVGGIFIVPAVRWPTVGRTLVGLFFIGGALYNALVTLGDPTRQLTGLVSTAPVPLYRDVVRLAVEWNVATVLTLAVIGFEVVAGCLSLWRGTLVRLALLAAGAWGLGMLPVIPPQGILLGVALTGASGVAALLLYRRSYPESVIATVSRHLPSGESAKGAPTPRHA